MSKRRVGKRQRKKADIETVKRIHGNKLSQDKWDRLFASRPPTKDEVRRLVAAGEISTYDTIRIAYHRWWEQPGWTAREIAETQLAQRKLVMDIDALQEVLQEALERPVWTHEMAEPDKLLEELQGKRPAKTFGEIEGQLQELAGDTPIIKVEAPPDKSVMFPAAEAKTMPAPLNPTLASAAKIAGALERLAETVGDGIARALARASRKDEDNE